MQLAQATKTFSVRFGGQDTKVTVSEAGLVLELRVPHLAGPALEWLPADPTSVVQTEPGVHLLLGENLLVGALLRPADSETLEAAAHAIFQKALTYSAGYHLYRVWNYVPNINAITDGLENYHRFNIGRFRAFSEHFGATPELKMPAASAVGIDDASLVTLFVAGRDPVRYFENPEQMPAWKYPAQYGPKSPSFSRGSLRHRPGEPQAFVSGTASIKGHETIGSGDLAKQCRVTCENLRLVLQSMGQPDPFTPDAPTAQSKVYLRRAADLAKVQELLTECAGAAFVRTATFLRADICRPCLDVEIEITVS